MTIIRNIIFDLGHVILNVDVKSTVNDLNLLAKKSVDFKDVAKKFKEERFYDLIDSNKITTAGLRTVLRKYLRAKVSDSAIDKAWCAMLKDISVEKYNFLKTNKEKYRIFLLSNTCELHHECYTKYVQKEFGLKLLDDLFEKAYYSFKLGIIKPSPEIFNLVLSENNLVPEETLFIDDVEVNIEAARKLGIIGYLYKGNETFESIVKLLNC
ncbi:MAG: HAD family phosphatase [Bacteroidales bacterium]|nr:HAD family phosphatase [Bacteroidales bacterium]